jgi:hypothetical protein
MKAKNGISAVMAAGVWLMLTTVLAWGVWPAGATSFDTIDVPGAEKTYVTGVNKSGQISGYYVVTEGSNQFSHGFISDGVNFTTIDIPGAYNTCINGIHDSGSFVGSYTIGANQHGFVHDGVNYQVIDVPDARHTMVYAINNAGVMAGTFYDSTGTHGFIYDGNNFTTLNVPGASATMAYGINNSGKISGTYQTTEGSTISSHGFVYDGVTYTPIDIPGATRTLAYKINDAGVIVGYYAAPLGTALVSHGFTFDGVNHTTVDVPDAKGTIMTCISNTGRVGGTYLLSTQIHGCVSRETNHVNLVDYFVPGPFSRWCTYSYLTPVGFPGFTLRFTPVTSGKYAGKYRMGDWNTPENELAVWRIVSWDQQAIYVYADSQIGDLPSPVSFSTIFPENTPVPNPLPNEEGIYWYFKTLPSLTVAAGTFKDVLLDIVLDAAYPPNAMNTELGLSVPYAVTSVTYYARGIGEIKNLDVEAQTGNIRFSYQLQDTGFTASMPWVQLLLGDSQ